MNYFEWPATYVVYIESPEAIAGISVYNAAGSCVISAEGNGATNSALQVENLPAGVYFIKVSGTSSTEVLRIIKK